MKQKLINLSRRYVRALEKHLKPGAGAGLEPALGLGRAAVALGLDTLELARIHELALATLQLSKAKNASAKLAGIFFAEANLPIEETHRTVRRGNARLRQLRESLGQRVAELAAADRRGKGHQKSLQESLKLQQRLRQLTHCVLAAQEDDRKKISRELQDEIAQTLLGINVRLLSLKRHSRGNTKGLKNEIASAQRLVVNSAKSVRRFARELTLPYAAQHAPLAAML